MIFIKQIKYEQLYELIGKKVHFISDCDFFPNFDIVVKIISYNIGNNNEILFNTITDDIKHKKMIIGSNMKNLQYEIVG